MSNYETKFIYDIVISICDYAVNNGLNPNATLKLVAKTILVLLDIGDFNEWGNDNE